MTPDRRAGVPAGLSLRQNGFTLLELMVVVVIIGIIVTVAVISLGGNPGRTLDVESRRFTTLVRLAADEAVLQSREIGMRINDNGYEFLVYDDQFQSWQSMERESIYRPRQMPDTITMTLYVDDQELVLPVSDNTGDSDDPDDQDREILEPQILLLSSGEMTPFEIVLEMEIAEREILLRGTPNGVVKEVSRDER